MLLLRLIRELQTPERAARATTGYLETEPHRIFTLERPWVPAPVIPLTTAAGPAGTAPPCGRKGVSCVPPGRYKLVPHNSEAHPNTVALVNPDLWVYHFPEDVPEGQESLARTAVLIHPANYVSELRGCIAPGWARGGGLTPEVHESRRAFAQLALDWPDEIEIVAPGAV